MQFPAHVIFEKEAGGERAAVDEEDDADGEVGDYGAFCFLLGGGDLDLGGDKDDGAHGEQEPLVFEEPEKP